MWSCKTSARIMAGGNMVPISLIPQITLATGVLTSNRACGLRCGCYTAGCHVWQLKNKTVYAIWGLCWPMFVLFPKFSF